MQKIVNILTDEKGQGTVEILVAITGIAIIAVAIVNALTNPVEKLHDHTVDGITKITGSGF